MRARSRLAAPWARFACACSTAACALLNRRLRLIDLLVEFRRIDLRQQLARLHAIADIDQAAFEIAVGARQNRRLSHRLHRPGQLDLALGRSALDPQHRQTRQAVLLRHRFSSKGGLALLEAADSPPRMRRARTTRPMRSSAEMVVRDGLPAIRRRQRIRDSGASRAGASGRPAAGATRAQWHWSRRLSSDRLVTLA